MFSFIGLTNKWYSTILPVASMELPVTIFLVTSYISTVPKELEEAAAIDGSGFSRTLFYIILPIVTPVLVTAGIIAFFHCWNEFSYSLILFSNEKLYTISLALTRFKGENRIDYPKMMTAMTITMIPALLLYVSFSKQIIKGMVAGAVKG
jgi:raffinose/stachyose/melibiose transport system permease protein